MKSDAIVFDDEIEGRAALLQPAQYSAVSLGEQTLFPQDIRGAACLMMWPCRRCPR